MKIGIDLGGSHIAIGVIDENLNIVEQTERRILSEEKDEAKSIIEKYIFEVVESFKQKYNIEELGLAVPGTIKGSTIIKSVNLGIENYNIGNILEEKLKLPIKVRNDAKCAALAEAEIGNLKEYKRILFLTLGTGIGGAVIIDGKLLDTGDLPGCEFGHMVINKSGILCNCGKNGCFEKYASMKALKNNLKSGLNLDSSTRGEDLLEMMRNNKNNEEMNKIIDEFIDNLSIGISNLVNIFEPEAIGIGGSFTYFHDVLLDRLIENIQKKEYLFNKREELKILPATLENNAGIIGSCI